MQVYGLCGTDIQWRQQGYDLPGTARFHIGVSDQLTALLANARHLRNPVRLTIQYVQSILPKLIVDLGCQLLAATFDQAGGQIGDDAVLTRCDDLFIGLHFKL